ncbi:hypothetical protein RMS29_025945 (plasmid) [Agrobacterium rosae]|uniref:Uncharacterized protein n=1 Tax=Agrobacterium rosae TaxID=1972867 RepID=A0AAW9FSJ0_9HYPH|nr:MULTISPECIES: hypothetical protein [Agrobacterium]MDX8321463.1 hypothetical protein [Agrobacterium sp. rho-8.1]MDX8305484.1 hypothetical protein [Agrobacterium rosae]MDX8311006.1 hypothetical protein [Agrobacterium sp. rho-13.3]MDX8316859.1 hypothetical protein [Agrobacterium rosae]MDX8327270.1 hypothetical protein [Agrobacterium tumefaciens]
MDIIAAVWVRQLVKGMPQIGDRILEQWQLDGFGQAQVKLQENWARG